MAEHVSLKTSFYEDPYIQSLPPTDKFLFLYLISNPNNPPTLGIYELSLHTMAFHTGLDRENIEHSLRRFADNGKIHYIDGFVIIKNHFKANPLKGNEKLLANTHKLLSKLPWSIKERLEAKSDALYIPYLDPTHTLYIGPEPVPTRPIPVTNPTRGTTRTGASPGRGKRGAPWVLNLDEVEKNDGR